MKKHTGQGFSTDQDMERFFAQPGPTRPWIRKNISHHLYRCYLNISQGIS